MYEFASCVAISVISYGIAFAIKKANILADKFIPLILFGLGALLGVAAYATNMPSFPANDIITALAVGIYSSMMAVGINQVFKQVGKDE